MKIYENTVLGVFYVSTLLALLLGWNSQDLVGMLSSTVITIAIFSLVVTVTLYIKDYLTVPEDKLLQKLLGMAAVFAISSLVFHILDMHEMVVSCLVSTTVSYLLVVVKSTEIVRRA